MQRVSIIVSLVMLGILVSGCDFAKKGDVSAEVARQLGPCRDQIMDLQQKNQALEDEIKSLKEQISNNADISEKVVKQVKADMSDDIADIVDEIFVQRVGTSEEIEASFRNAVQEELKAAEKKRNERGRAERDKRRKQWEERKKQWEQSRMDKMAEELKLSDAQKDKVSEITKASDKKMQDTMRSIYQEKGMDMDAMKKAREEIVAERYDQMRKILDDEQYQSYTNSQADWNKMVDQFMGGGRDHGH